MENNIITRKIKLSIVGDKEEVDRVYKFLRDAIYNQNKAYNILASNVFAAIYSGATKEQINEIYKKGKRQPKQDSPEYSLYKFGEVSFQTGLNQAPSIGMMVQKDMSNAIKKGLLKGNISLQNKKLKSPLRIEPKLFDLYYDCPSLEEFLANLYTNKCRIYMKFVNGIVFELQLGNNVKKSAEIRSIFEKIFVGIYKTKGSSIEIDGTKIILNLSIEQPNKEIVLDESIVIGVDIGIAIPAVCALNANDYIRSSIGSSDDFIRVRTKIQAQRKRLNEDLAKSKGGHGRSKKLSALDRFEKYERNWVRNYNHMLSRRIVNFAIQNKAKYINIENLEGFRNSGNNYILRNWSYYQLQQDIIYKAKMVGIEVRKVNPYRTSQVCSCCGHWEEGQRKDQAHFVCGSCGAELNADFNAARNIAMSTDFIK